MSPAQRLQGLLRGKLLAGSGDSPAEGWAGLDPHSRLSQLLAFSHRQILILAHGPEHRRPGLYTQHPWSSWGLTCYLTHRSRCPQPHMQRYLSFPPTSNCLHQPRGRQKWLLERVMRDRGVTITHNPLSWGACSHFSHSGLNHHWLCVCKKYCCITHTCIVKS